MIITKEEREKERALFEHERQRVPELFDRQPMIDDITSLKRIGIATIDQELPIGYIRYLPQDFIVEEIAADGTLQDVDIDTKSPNFEGAGTTYYADLVKIGISTLEAKKQLGELLGIDEKHIGFAGIKDRLALTGQRLSFRNLPDPQILRTITAENFFLKNIMRSKGAIANGELTGNRFIITLRSPETLTKERVTDIERKLAEIEHNGFWNFFSFQRFGTPRLISHLLGLFLVKGEYEKVVKTFITCPAPRELPYFKEIRRELESMWGDWEKIKERLDPFAYHFHLERSLIHHLCKNPNDFLGALHTIPDQIRLWMYSYDCYLYNRKLSEYIKEGSVPEKLPLITSFDPKDWEIYKKFLVADGVQLPSNAYKDFPFIRIESRTWPTRQKLTLHGFSNTDRTAVFAFSLGKGSYATSVLMNFFQLAAGLPVVPNIPTDQIDAKALLHMGSLAPTLERFKTVLKQREKDLLEERSEN